MGWINHEILERGAKLMVLFGSSCPAICAFVCFRSLCGDYLNIMWSWINDREVWLKNLARYCFLCLSSSEAVAVAKFEMLVIFFTLFSECGGRLLPTGTNYEERLHAWIFIDWMDSNSMLYYTENNTWARRNMEFLFSCSTLYLTREKSNWTREKKFHISARPCIICCFIYVSKRLIHSIQDWEWITRCRSFMALNRANDMSAADWRSQRKIILIFRVWRYGFSHCWKSLESTPVYIINH